MKHKLKKSKILEYGVSALFIISCICKSIFGNITKIDFVMLVVCTLLLMGISCISESIIKTQERIIEAQKEIIKKQNEFIEILKR